ncbi:hypothetical protein GBAR_LOCUS7005 [Geodia barretti]|uniref:Uncharacterized protein n=1 Tax=Geodia barretti TaxID=519541 RepID=A0AA35WB30_GEOBA|nr:hypothetical protein GBAR_LOCUS7005 [Geodia barretti]
MYLHCLIDRSTCAAFGALYGCSSFLAGLTTIVHNATILHFSDHYSPARCHRTFAHALVLRNLKKNLRIYETRLHQIVKMVFQFFNRGCNILIFNFCSGHNLDDGIWVTLYKFNLNSSIASSLLGKIDLYSVCSDLSSKRPAGDIRIMRLVEVAQLEEWVLVQKLPVATCWAIPHQAVPENRINQKVVVMNISGFTVVTKCWTNFVSHKPPFSTMQEI